MICSFGGFLWFFELGVFLCIVIFLTFYVAINLGETITNFGLEGVLFWGSIPG